MTQTQQVIETMRRLGGVATFGKLNSEVDFSFWGTKTPEASVRRIVQNSPDIFKLRPGLWALKEYEEEIRARFDIAVGNEREPDAFSHTYYQGLAVEIGNFRDVDTYVPNQDKNRLYINKPLKEVASLQEMLHFSYTEIVDRARTIDVIWFNERHLLCAFFEIEHSTDIQNSLLKYYDLQDFSADFYIIADEYRRSKFSEIITRSVFKPIRDRVKFKSYKLLSDTHSLEYRRNRAEAL